MDSAQDAALRRKVRQKEMLYGGMSNEIQRPINVILNAAELLERRCAGQEELLEMVHAIDDSCRHLSRLGTNLVELAACLSGSNLPCLARVNLRRQLCHLLEETAPFAARQQLSLVWEPEAMPEVYPLCDAVMLDRILLNLLSNALRYSRPGGTVRVALTVEGDAPPRICVRDSGPGIPDAVLTQLFALFRAPEEGEGADGLEGSAAAAAPARAESSAGMGLYLAHELCGAMGWALRVENAPEGGALAVIELRGGPQEDAGAVTLSSGVLAEEIFRQEQAARVRTEMEALFGRAGSE